MSHTAHRFRLAAVGDVMLARGVGRHFVEAPGDFTMDDVREVLRPYDVVCANLENPVAEGGSPDPLQDPNVTFRAHPETLNVLKTLGVGVVSLGNNHMLDYGESALAETLERVCIETGDGPEIGREPAALGEGHGTRLVGLLKLGEVLPDPGGEGCIGDEGAQYLQRRGRHTAIEPDIGQAGAIADDGLQLAGTQRT